MNSHRTPPDQSKINVARARAMRAEPTDAERRLWAGLRRDQLEGLTFRRQEPIGSFIVDFVCYSIKLIVELDGGQHGVQIERDDRRTAWLESQGFRVLRFWNNEVLSNTDGVMEAIRNAIVSAPHPNPPPQGGRGQEGRGA